MSKLTQLQQDVLWLIPDGSDAAKSAREICGLAHISQRELRKHIRMLRYLGVPIVSGDKGYYLPDLNDPLDVAWLQATSSERARAATPRSKWRKRWASGSKPESEKKG